jgi:hypothetical protein
MGSALLAWVVAVNALCAGDSELLPLGIFGVQTIAMIVRRAVRLQFAAWLYSVETLVFAPRPAAMV